MKSAVGSRQFEFSRSRSAQSALTLVRRRSRAQQVPKGQMPTLGRPTESSDKVPLFDFDTYFLGKWTFEWSMPESAARPGRAVHRARRRSRKSTDVFTKR